MFVVKENEQIRLAVRDGQRPDLSVITGPEPLRTLIVDLIKRCWHQSPDERPAFASTQCTEYQFTMILNTTVEITVDKCVKILITMRKFNALKVLAQGP